MGPNTRSREHPKPGQERALVLVPTSVSTRTCVLGCGSSRQAGTIAGGVEPGGNRAAVEGIYGPQAVDVSMDVRRRVASPGVPALAHQGFPGSCGPCLCASVPFVTRPPQRRREATLRGWCSHRHRHRRSRCSESSARAVSRPTRASRLCLPGWQGSCPCRS